MAKNTPANAGSLGSIPRSGRWSGVRSNNPLQYSCLKSPMDRAVWWATVHGVTESQAQLSTHATPPQVTVYGLLAKNGQASVIFRTFT